MLSKQRIRETQRDGHNLQLAIPLPKSIGFPPQWTLWARRDTVLMALQHVVCFMRMYHICELSHWSITWPSTRIFSPTFSHCTWHRLDYDGFPGRELRKKSQGKLRSNYKVVVVVFFFSRTFTVECSTKVKSMVFILENSIDIAPITYSEGNWISACWQCKVYGIFFSYHFQYGA